MNPLLRAALAVLASAAGMAAFWTVAASCLFLKGTGLWGNPGVPQVHYLWGWFAYLPYARANMTVALGVVISALVVAVPILLLAFAIGRARLRALGGLRGVGHYLGIGQIRRSPSRTHGSADWMDDERIQQLFPPTPHPEIGGVVVGERSRDDLTRQHDVPFNPKDPTSWGVQGKGELMFDHCERGTTHSIIIGGGGAYKSTTLTTTLLHWKPSAVIQDPAGELFDKVGQALRDQGKTVIKLDLGVEGPNVLDAIDLSTEDGALLAESRLLSVVGRIIGPMPKDDSGNSGRFKRWGRSIIVALLADLMWRNDVPRDLKNLRTLRAGLNIPSERLRDRLRGIYEVSPSHLARSMAAGVMDLPDETWGGALGNAMDDTSWLASDTYADLVSGGAFKLRDIVKGQHAVFCQVPQEVLQITPALSRVLIGGMLDAVFAANGRVAGRVGFFIDEAVLLGPEPSLKLARDQGRKYKVTLQLFYQSEGQIADVWGDKQRDAWFDGVSFRSYTRIQSLATAKDLAATLGTFGAVTESRGNNAGLSGRPMEWATRQRGENTNESEVGRDLAKPHELLQELRANERITIVANDRPIRHTSAIDFCRPDIIGRLGNTNFQMTFQDEDLEGEAA